MSSQQSFPNGELQLPVFFACIFYNTDTMQYHECRHMRLRRPSDVSWHLERCHTLQEVRLCTTREAKAAVKNGKEKSICTDPKEIKVYDPICRLMFCGPTAEADRQRHLDANMCELKTIEETGKLLPGELQEVLKKRDRAKASPEDKWYAMWSGCIPPLATTRFWTVPASPYVQTTVAREAAETIIRRALDNLHITTELHRSTFDEIVNGLYPAQSGAGPKVKKIVKEQQKKRTSILEAEVEKFYRSAFNSSEVTPLGLQPAAPLHHQLQKQTLEQANNGMASPSSLLSGESHPLQQSYSDMPSHYPHPETQAPSQMTGSAYGQYMESYDYHPSNEYTGGFSDAY
ncbi:uncharacterized protein FMAN_11160 [Fusarium mangiferae]|uniref:Uncharacterized protein n=1 Tax=Fusarium mangiferae TaxID=192010 RepID=A0A1L7TDR2_FUSMA|nr:uncharacterized protein FMAN_11160 [Fusarium mangiferae]CVK96840.1 uncharacterized protein FMAN_11160 [Fusarium mangiferae]